MIQFYTADIAESRTLNAEESAHCARVLRKKAGDRIYVTDGKGRRYECEIVKADPKGVKVEILKAENVDKGWDTEITLAVAPTKNADRMAWLVEKCTEIGVDRICFLQCRHSERKAVNTERLRRNAISAMNQSLKTRLPEISEMQSLKEILTLEGEKYFGYCDADTERKEFSKEFRPGKGKKAVIAIGPEGDFSAEEVRAMLEAGFQAVTFGKERLRTETAAIYGVASVHVLENAFE